MIVAKSRRTRTYGERRLWNHFSPPPWRWETAGEIARGEARSTKEDDPTLQAAIRLRTRVERGNPYKRPNKLARLILEALPIFEGNGLLRWELETRLLAGQTDAEISRQTGVEPEVIATYEQTFCNIRDCLGANDYLRKHLIGDDKLLGGFDKEDLRPFWAWIAIYGDRAILDRLLTVFRSVYRPGEPANLEVYLRPDARIPMEVQSLVAGMFLPYDPVGAKLLYILGDEMEEVAETEDAIVRQRRLETLRHKVIQYARRILSGRPLPEAEIDRRVARVREKRHADRDKRLEPARRFFARFLDGKIVGPAYAGDVQAARQPRSVTKAEKPADRSANHR